LQEVIQWSSRGRSAGRNGHMRLIKGIDEVL